MSRQLPLELSSEVVLTPSLEQGQFEIVAGAGQICLRGHLSTGSRGWRLRAEARSLRSKITLQITAIEAPGVRVPDIEHHEYAATIQVKRPGRYRLTVAHAYFLRGVGGYGLPGPVFDGTLVVP